MVSRTHNVRIRTLLTFSIVIVLSLSFASGSSVADGGVPGGGSATPTGKAFLTVNVATCAVGYTGETAADYDANCADNPAEAVPLTLTPGLDGTGSSLLTTSGVGIIDVQLHPVQTTYEVGVPDITGIQGYLVFCIESGKTNAAFDFEYSAEGFALTNVTDGDALICDLYLIPSGTTAVITPGLGVTPAGPGPLGDTPVTVGSVITTDGGLAVTALPTTGAGDVTSTSTSLFAMLMLAAVGCAAIATRRFGQA